MVNFSAFSVCASVYDNIPDLKRFFALTTEGYVLPSQILKLLLGHNILIAHFVTSKTEKEGIVLLETSPLIIEITFLNQRSQRNAAES
jgi:hypothetical protein